MILNNAQSTISTQTLTHLLVVMTGLWARKDDYCSTVFSCFRSELWAKKGHFTSKARVKNAIDVCCLAEHKHLLFDLVETVHHGNKSTSSHERVITSLMVALWFHVLLHMLEVDVRIRLETLFAETWQVERFQVDFDWFNFRLESSWDDFCVEKVGK